jgi:hypothetical protein
MSILSKVRNFFKHKKPVAKESLRSPEAEVKTEVEPNPIVQNIVLKEEDIPTSQIPPTPPEDPPKYYPKGIPKPAPETEGPTPKNNYVPDLYLSPCYIDPKARRASPFRAAPLGQRYQKINGDQHIYVYFTESANIKDGVYIDRKTFYASVTPKDPNIEVFSGIVLINVKEGQYALVQLVLPTENDVHLPQDIIGGITVNERDTVYTASTFGGVADIKVNDYDHYITDYNELLEHYQDIPEGLKLGTIAKVDTKIGDFPMIGEARLLRLADHLGYFQKGTDDNLLVWDREEPNPDDDYRVTFYKNETDINFNVNLIIGATLAFFNQKTYEISYIWVLLGTIIKSGNLLHQNLKNLYAQQEYVIKTNEELMTVYPLEGPFPEGLKRGSQARIKYFDEYTGDYVSGTAFLGTVGDQTPYDKMPGLSWVKFVYQSAYNKEVLIPITREITYDINNNFVSGITKAWYSDYVYTPNCVVWVITSINDGNHYQTFSENKDSLLREVITRDEVIRSSVVQRIAVDGIDLAGEINFTGSGGTVVSLDQDTRTIGIKSPQVPNDIVNKIGSATGEVTITGEGGTSVEITENTITISSAVEPETYVKDIEISETDTLSGSIKMEGTGGTTVRRLEGTTDCIEVYSDTIPEDIVNTISVEDPEGTTVTLSGAVNITGSGGTSVSMDTTNNTIDIYSSSSGPTNYVEALQTDSIPAKNLTGVLKLTGGDNINVTQDTSKTPNEIVITQKNPVPSSYVTDIVINRGNVPANNRVSFSGYGATIISQPYIYDYNPTKYEMSISSKIVIDPYSLYGQTGTDGKTFTYYANSISAINQHYFRTVIKNPYDPTKIMLGRVFYSLNPSSFVDGVPYYTNSACYCRLFFKSYKAENGWAPASSNYNMGINISYDNATDQVNVDMNFRYANESFLISRKVLDGVNANVFFSNTDQSLRSVEITDFFDYLITNVYSTEEITNGLVLNAIEMGSITGGISYSPFLACVVGSSTFGCLEFYPGIRLPL